MAKQAPVFKTVNISDLKEYENNPNTHDEKQITDIASNMVVNGFVAPIIITQDNMIVAGHGRIYAAKRIGLEKAPAMIIGNDWTEDDIKAYVIADNALCRRSSWDDQLIALESQSLFEAGYDMTLLGLEPAELEQHLGFADEMYNGKPDDADSSGPSEKTCPKCGHTW